MAWAILVFVATTLPAVLSQELPQAIFPEGNLSYTANEGSAVTFECTFTGSPTPTITWLQVGHNGTVSGVNTSTQQSANGTENLSTLTITSTQDSDSGQYLCLATNSAGNASRGFDLIVQVAPVLLAGPVDSEVSIGVPVTFNCTAVGRPRPIIMWYIIDKMNATVPVHLSTRVTVSEVPIGDRSMKSTLSFTHVLSTEFGTYVCYAENVIGNATSTAGLIEEEVLSFLSFGSTPGVKTEAVGHFDNGVSHVIHIPGGFPFGTRIHDKVYIGSNGYFSFDQPFYEYSPEPFPGTFTVTHGSYLVAPFWDDIDLRNEGSILYEVHTPATSQALLTKVSELVLHDGSFSATWMLVARWDQVHSWPHGESEREVFESVFGVNSTLVNTFQGILITNGTESYTAFTYKCGEMEWTFDFPTIGYNAAGDDYRNHSNTGSPNAHGIACLNLPTSVWYNVVYKLSVNTSATTLSPPPTLEPAQEIYLEFLEVNDSKALDGCLNCSSESIYLGEPGIPFGHHYHNTAYVATNGIISFSAPILQNSPALFPTEEPSTFSAYIVAPYWTNIDTRLNGSVRYKAFNSSNSTDAQSLKVVADFINIENGTITDPSWMLVATWDGVHPFPHGESAEQDRQDPYLQSINTFQAIVISNGTKTYSVFTYKCDKLEWSGEAVVGFNAGGDIFENHPLSGRLDSRLTGCVHLPGSQWNNVVYDLSPVEASLTTPVTPSTFGSCAAYTECCDDRLDQNGCTGSHSDCNCGRFCVIYGDCCADYSQSLCQVSSGNDSYLLLADILYIGKVSLDGNDYEVVNLPHGILRHAFALDVDYGRGFMYWSDSRERAIYKAHLNGSGLVRLLDTAEYGTVGKSFVNHIGLYPGIPELEDIAVDWVSNKLYWTETAHRRIDVLDLDTMLVTTVVNADPNSGMRGIAVDPLTRYMYWTDWGGPAKIERASMDGAMREVLHTEDLVDPSGICIDYDSQTIYWTDNMRSIRSGTIEYSYVNGTNRTQLRSSLRRPFFITVDGSRVFWTDVSDHTHAGVINSATGRGTHITEVLETYSQTPAGLQIMGPGRQPEGNNVCANSECEHLCLLSASDERGYSCACSEGYLLDINNATCIYIGTQPPLIEKGSCVKAGFNDSCCTGGHCNGLPVTASGCFCDANCYSRDDCCEDINATCPMTSSCRAAGFDTCCDSSNCAGVSTLGGCFCDQGCHLFGDCCDDIGSTCPRIVPECPPLTVTNGSVVYSSTTLIVNTEATILCDKGFVRIGAKSIRCHLDTTWEPAAAICEEIVCPHLVALDNGQINDTSYHLGASVSYECLQGFTLIGNPIRVCVQDNGVNGVWTGVSPLCQQTTCLACAPPMVCVNQPGGYICTCPEGTTRANDMCEGTVPSEVTANSVAVTLQGYNASTFDERFQRLFRETTADVLNVYCAENQEKCSVEMVRFRRSIPNITSEDVVLMEILSSEIDQVMFNMYIRVQGGVLTADDILQAAEHGSEDYQEAGFDGLSFDGLVPATEVPSYTLNAGQIVGIIIIGVLVTILGVMLVIIIARVFHLKRKCNRRFTMASDLIYDNPVSESTEKLEKEGGYIENVSLKDAI